MSYSSYTHPTPGPATVEVYAPGLAVYTTAADSVKTASVRVETTGDESVSFTGTSPVRVTVAPSGGRMHASGGGDIIQVGGRNASSGKPGVHVQLPPDSRIVVLEADQLDITGAKHLSIASHAPVTLDSL